MQTKRNPLQLQKRCPTCATAKPHTEFHVDRARRDGRRAICKTCHNERNNRRRARLSPRQTRQWDLRKTYGIDHDQYDALLERQGGVCGICASEPDAGKYLHVDHDHESGSVRGLLCSRCNRAVGLLGDTPEGVERALAYLAARATR